MENLKKAPESSFEELIQRVSQGSETAAWELIERYHKNILRLVRQRLPTSIRGKVDSIDIVQSVWKSLFKIGDRLDHARSADEIMAYLAGMARNKVYEAHRRFTRCQQTDVGREVHLDDKSSAEGLVDPREDFPSAIVSAKEKWDMAIASSGERGQRAIKLKLQGLSLDEIAGELKVNKRTVQRILQSLLESITA